MINVIGLGYIGLPTALMLAAKGAKVVGTDYNKELVETLKSGKLTFEEKGMQELFEIALKKGIIFTTEYQKQICISLRYQHRMIKLVKRLMLVM